MDSNEAFGIRIPRQSLASAVAEKLRNKIILGELQEGEQLRQATIAAEFQVSRIPVREAFNQLLSEGLIDLIPNRGAVVSALSPAEIEELFQIRGLLEPVLLRASIPRLTDEHFARAEAILARYQRELEDRQNVSTWGRLNFQFHTALYAGTRMPQFEAVIRAVNNNSERYIRMQLLFLTQGRPRAKQEHQQLLDLCRARKVDAACALLERHVREAGRSLRQMLEQSRTLVKPRGGAANATG